MHSDHSIEASTWDGYPGLTLYSPDLEVAVVPSAGMLTTSVKHQGVELLAQLATVGEYAEEGRPTGIPFLVPFPNRLAGWAYEFDDQVVELDPDAIARDDRGLPIHGLRRAPAWQHSSDATGQAATITATLDVEKHEALYAAFPFPATLRLTLRLSHNRLRIWTTVQAKGARVPVSHGHHPFLQLSSTPRADWTVDFPVRTQIVLGESGLPTREVRHVEPIRGTFGERTLDDHYAVGAGTGFTIDDGARSLTVFLDEGYPYAQIYAPEGGDFLSIEPMTSPVNALRDHIGLQVVEAGNAYASRWGLNVNSVER
jgi:aldose 1-epimerase